jgi:hypothetical protein
MPEGTDKAGSNVSLPTLENIQGQHKETVHIPPFGILQNHDKICPSLRVATPTICREKRRSAANKTRGFEREKNGSERL